MRNAVCGIALLCLFSVVGLAAPPPADEHAWLGVTLVSGPLPAEEGAPAAAARIVTVFDDSPAAKAGLEANDIIVKIDGTDVADIEDLTKYLGSKSPGDQVLVTVRRDGAEQAFTAALAARKGRNHMAVRIFNGDEESDAPVCAEVKRGHIGVFLQDLTPELREYFGADKEQGVLVSRIEENGPAAKAGVRVGDVIVSVNGEAVSGNRDVQSTVRNLKTGEDASLSILRGGKTEEIKVAVEERSAKRVQVMFGPENGVIRIPDFDVDLPDIDLDELREGLSGLKEKFEFQSHEPGKDEHKVLYFGDHDFGKDARVLGDYFGSPDFQDKVEKLKALRLDEQGRIQDLEKKLKELEEKLKALETKK